MLRRSLIAAAAAAFLLPASASAQGPGQYRIKGVDARTAQLSKTGDDTWRIVWRIGNQTWNGHGIGDGKVLAVNYSGQGVTGIFLMIARDSGGYEAVWSYTGGTTVGSEEWVKAN
jgi:hypothetical protein